MSVTHSKVSGQPNTDPDKVGGEDWDADHVVALSDADIPATIARDAEVTSAISTHAGEADPHTGYQKESEKAAASGYASLDGTTKVPIAQLPTGTTGTTVALGNAAAGLITTHEAASDPHTGYVREADANWVDLTDGGETALHSHAAGAGAPTNADYLVGTANGSLSNEIVVGTSPGGELGGTWASPTVDATHAGSTHVSLGTTPSTQAFGDSATGGSATDAAKTDHKHAMPTLGFGLTGNSAPAVSLTNVTAAATATTSISAATYADVTGLSTGALAAGTWLIIATVTGSSVNAHALMHVAITHSDNTVQREASSAIPASGSANVASNGSVTVVAIVSGGATYKVRAARGNTTLTGTWVAMDGAGIGVTNNLTDNSDKGSHLVAIRIA